MYLVSETRNFSIQLFILKQQTVVFGNKCPHATTVDNGDLKITATHCTQRFYKKSIPFNELTGLPPLVATCPHRHLVKYLQLSSTAATQPLSRFACSIICRYTVSKDLPFALAQCAFTQENAKRLQDNKCTEAAHSQRVRKHSAGSQVIVVSR